MSRLYSAIKRLAQHGDRAAIGLVLGMAGPSRYRVQIDGREHVVPAAGGASALDGQSVAVLVSGKSGQGIAMLGPVNL
jgi:hypothetical protein